MALRPVLKAGLVRTLTGVTPFVNSSKNRQLYKMLWKEQFHRIKIKHRESFTLSKG
jgi:hypothetical protein